MNRLLTLFLLLSGVLSAEDKAFHGFEPITAPKAMVVCAEPLACDIGVEILQRGGNAVDASVAIAFALAVTYPNAGNIGGGGFMIYRDPQKQVYALDYREKAPRKASKKMYQDERGIVESEKATFGYLAAGVPGTVDGLWKAHQRFGKFDWNDLLKPAIRLAEEGFIPGSYQLKRLESAVDDFNKTEDAKSIFTDDGKPFKSGTLLIQRDLAETLKRIAKDGRNGFYQGKTAQLIDAAMKRHGGLITARDLEHYQSVWRKPIEGSYRGYHFYSMPPPSSGGIILSEILNTLELFPLAEYGLHSANLIHLWAEIERAAYRDRALYLGDPDFVEMPLEQLISKEYAIDIREKLTMTKAGKSQGLPGSTIVPESDQTTHFSIVDRWGGAVSNTTTLNGNYGARVVAAGTGILLNNEMDDFSLKPGYPNSYGLIGSDANAIQASKRMLSSMTPTIVTKNDSLFMVIGGPGGSKIITTVAQVMSNIIDHKLNIRAAIETPRFHHQWLPDTLYLEQGRFNQDTKNNLRNKGYNLAYREYMGYAQGILINLSLKTLTGWSDPRSDGKAAGF